MWPAIIATNSRSARLNGRTMNESNSIRKISGSITMGVPCGMNSEKKWKPCRQKPTIRTIAKLMIAMIPVTVNWLVTVKGWAPTRANGIMPSRLANRMNMKTVNTQGMYLRPSGPMLVVTIELTKPVTPSTIDLPAAGDELALHPAEHEQPDQREDDRASTARCW